MQEACATLACLGSAGKSVSLCTLCRHHALLYALSCTKFRKMKFILQRQSHISSSSTPVSSSCMQRNGIAAGQMSKGAFARSGRALTDHARAMMQTSSMPSLLSHASARCPVRSLESGVVAHLEEQGLRRRSWSPSCPTADPCRWRSHLRGDPSRLPCSWHPSSRAHCLRRCWVSVYLHCHHVQFDCSMRAVSTWCCTMSVRHEEWNYEAQCVIGCRPLHARLLLCQSCDLTCRTCSCQNDS